MADELSGNTVAFPAAKTFEQEPTGPSRAVEQAGGRPEPMSTLTSWPSLRTDIRNAGGNRGDEEVVIDDSIVTSRKADDLPAFSRATLFAKAGSEATAR
jgi:putative intracellular protease/amidase